MLAFVGYSPIRHRPSDFTAQPPPSWVDCEYSSLAATPRQGPLDHHLCHHPDDLLLIVVQNKAEHHRRPKPLHRSCLRSAPLTAPSTIVPIVGLPPSLAAGAALHHSFVITARLCGHCCAAIAAALPLLSRRHCSRISPILFENQGFELKLSDPLLFRILKGSTQNPKPVIIT